MILHPLPVILMTLISVLSPLLPHINDKAPPSFADHLHVSHSKDPVDGGWLPNLTGLPNQLQVMMMQPHMIDIIMEEQDPQCTSIDLNLRMMIFQHFIIYQHMLNAQDIYLNDQTAYQWAHVLAMILKESSGDSTSITDMNGHSISTYSTQTNVQQWKKIFNLSPQGVVQLNYQTNFGLTQTSADRLFDVFRLAQDQQDNTAFLEGREGLLTPQKVELNTAIAIRRIIWFYQDFAQGRVVESDGRIPQQEINQPQFAARYKEGLNLALFYCGTRFMFHEVPLNSGEQNTAILQEAMSSIAYCKLGNPQTGYGMNEIDEKCFAEWVTLCPALNVDIATLTPLSYFATRNQGPVCEDTFKRLINKK